MKIIIVDDEYLAVQGILDGVAWDTLPFDEVLTANSYTEAVALMEKERPEILVCDIEMPDQSGLELVDWVNEHLPGTKSIILSCHDEFDYAARAVKLQCLEYVLKPVRYTKLTGIIQEAVTVVEKEREQTVLTEYGKQYVDSVAKKSSGNAIDAVETVAAYIKAHLAENLSVRELADMVYLSPDHLTRSFKKRYHKTVSDYILEKRMTLAGELLKKENLTITMVSDTVGFGNYSYFTEQFKKYYGMTPREYQKSMRQTL
jgi:YesN/AraC family two-component response regulator